MRCRFVIVNVLNATFEGDLPEMPRKGNLIRANPLVFSMCDTEFLLNESCEAEIRVNLLSDPADPKTLDQMTLNNLVRHVSLRAEDRRPLITSPA